MSLLNPKYDFIILVSLFTISNAFSQSGWIRQNSGITDTIYSVKFVNSNTGWCVGKNGIILNTTNGGKDWLDQSSDFSGSFNSVFFSSTNLGYVVGDSNSYGSLFKTTNGGINWIRSDLRPSVSLNTVFFIDDSLGFTAGYNYSILAKGKIYKTINGGATWDSIESQTTYTYSIYFINSSTGWHTGGYFAIGSQSVYKSTNGGADWFIQYDGQAPVYAIYFIDSLNGWFTGRSSFGVPTIFRTTNGGNNWGTIFPGTGNIVNSLYFTSKFSGWAAGNNKIIQATTDCGLNWVNQTSPQTGFTYRSVYFTDSLTGWVVGDSGTILKTTTGGVLTNFSNASSEIPDKYFLSQNYPNPFNPVTNLEFGISNLGFVTLKVYDVLGNEVTTLANEKKNAGSYNYQFSTVNYQLPSGIYFYSLSVDGNLVDTKRMILLK